MQSALRLIYPPQCLSCDAAVDRLGGLCANCWTDAHFITGARCLTCGTRLPGDAPGDETALCDDCLTIERPWKTGAAALLYQGTGRRLVLSLKHGDRLDLVRPMANWMAAQLRNPVQGGDAILPVPIHWTRLLKRRFNQSALLARALANIAGGRFYPDALQRTRATKPLDGISVAERFEIQAGSIAPHPRRGRSLKGKRILLVDDVMTSGATLAAAAGAARSAGAVRVDVVTVARVAKDL